MDNLFTVDECVEGVSLKARQTLTDKVCPNVVLVEVNARRLQNNSLVVNEVVDTVLKRLLVSGKEAYLLDGPRKIFLFAVVIVFHYSAFEPLLNYLPIGAAPQLSHRILCHISTVDPVC